MLMTNEQRAVIIKCLMEAMDEPYKADAFAFVQGVSQNAQNKKTENLVQISSSMNINDLREVEVLAHELGLVTVITDKPTDAMFVVGCGGGTFDNIAGIRISPNLPEGYKKYYNDGVKKSNVALLYDAVLDVAERYNIKMEKVFFNHNERLKLYRQIAEESETDTREMNDTLKKMHSVFEAKDIEMTQIEFAALITWMLPLMNESVYKIAEQDIHDILNRCDDTVKETNLMKIQVHDGPFHADDIAVLAFIHMINENISYIRSSNDSDAAIKADVLNSSFDHHDPKNIKLYDDGTKKASITLLYEAIQAVADVYGIDLSNKIPNIKQLPAFFKEISRVDNGQKKEDFLPTNIINTYMPLWNSGESIDSKVAPAVECMEKMISLVDEKTVDDLYEINKIIEDKNIALVLAAGVFERNLSDISKTYIAPTIYNNIKNSEKSVELGIALTKERAEIAAKERHPEIVVFEEGKCPYNEWGKVLPLTDAKFVTFKTSRGNEWGLQCVPPETDSQDQKLSIHLSKETINQMIGNKCVFVHPSKFYASFKDQQSAYEFAERYLKVRDKLLATGINNKDVNRYMEELAMKDSDGDGRSDLMELFEGTNRFKADSIGSKDKDDRER